MSDAITARIKRLGVSLLALIVVSSTAFGQSSDSEETSFVLIENKSDKLAKVAVPGGKAVRVQPGESDIRVDIDVTTRNGVEVKAWWISEPRQLCVIFVRYEGRAVVGGKKKIRCLGN